LSPLTEDTLSNTGWQNLNLPHIWNAQDAPLTKDYYRGIGWYRKTFSLSQIYTDTGGNATNRRFFIQFDGANHTADVYLNGKYLGQHRGGFRPFALN
jgi:beta-galactosidase